MNSAGLKAPVFVARGAGPWARLVPCHGQLLDHWANVKNQQSFARDPIQDMRQLAVLMASSWQQGSRAVQTFLQRALVYLPWSPFGLLGLHP